MKKLVWIGHYIETNDAFRFNDFRFQSKALKKLFVEVNKRMPPYVLTKLRSDSKGIEFYGIIAPLLPSQIASLSKEKQFKIIKHAIDISNRLGADQIGLAALFASLWEDGVGIKEHTKAHITTGKNLIAALVLDYVAKSTNILGKNPHDLTVGIIGYKNRIAKIFAAHYSKEAKNILVDSEVYGSEASNVKKTSFDDIFCNSDVVIVTTMGVGLADYIDKIKPGAIICDIVVPYHLTAEIRKGRKDVFAFEGVWSRYADLDGYKGKGIKRLFPKNVTPACVGELFILSQEKKLGNFSLGDNINYKNTTIMRSMIAKNGFSFFGFKQGAAIYSQEDIEKIKEASK